MMSLDATGYGRPFVGPGATATSVAALFELMQMMMMMMGTVTSVTDAEDFESFPAERLSGSEGVWVRSCW